MAPMMLCQQPPGPTPSSMNWYRPAASGLWFISCTRLHVALLAQSAARPDQTTAAMRTPKRWCGKAHPKLHKNTHPSSNSYNIYVT
eukprot:scaffold343651_cov41-Prasinocladus_malaysianus.AAC.1